ncbi:hypothetical protein ACJX0J_017486, partial [Zea mays]
MVELELTVHAALFAIHLFMAHAIGISATGIGCYFDDTGKGTSPNFSYNEENFIFLVGIFDNNCHNPNVLFHPFYYAQSLTLLDFHAQVDCSILHISSQACTILHGMPEIYALHTPIQQEEKKQGIMASYHVKKNKHSANYQITRVGMEEEEEEEEGKDFAPMF